MKKILLSIMCFSIAIISLSQIVYASTAQVNVQAPVYGVVYSNAALKQTASTNPKLDCTYFGWPGSGIESYVYGPGGRTSTTSSFSSTGPVNYWIAQNVAATLPNRWVSLAFGTDAGTWNACDIQGVFNPD